jgi:hypothetical protein
MSLRSPSGELCSVGVTGAAPWTAAWLAPCGGRFYGIRPRLSSPSIASPNGVQTVSQMMDSPCRGRSG